MIEATQKDAMARMQKCVEVLQTNLAKIRTSRAHPSLLDNIKVMHYGNLTPLSQVANVMQEDARTLSITPWEKSMVGAIDKAVRSANLGLNPVTAGLVIRVPMPALTEDRRRDLIKQVKAEIEQAKVAIRNVRRDSNTQIKNLLKDKVIREDEEHKSQDWIQKNTDTCIASLDKIASVKETELLQV